MGIRRTSMWLAAAAAIVLLGACADPDAPGDPGSPSPPAVTPPATPDPPMPTPTPGVERTITGEVFEGVEINCLLLRTAEDDFLLIGEHEEVRIGQEATVRGYADPGMMTTCQQGTPFVVLEVLSP